MCLSSMCKNFFWANNRGQRGVAHLGNLEGLSLSSVTVPDEGYTRFGVPLVEGDTYVALAAEGEEGHFIVFRIVELNLGAYVEIEFEYR